MYKQIRKDRWIITVLKNLLYRMFKRLVGVCFNILNLLLAGNLPPLGSVCVIVEDQDRYLVVERAGGSFVFPGGFMRWREHPTQTAIRELKEETGLRVKLHHVVACYSKTSRSFGRMSTLMLVFCAEVNGGEMRGSVEGQPFWIEESDLLEMPDFCYKYMLNDYREHRKRHDSQEFCGTFVREMAEKNL